MIYQHNTAEKAVIIGTGKFLTTGEILSTIVNTTGTEITLEWFATGKYRIRTNPNGQPLFKENKTVIFPEISESASIPLSKTTWGDYNYHFTWQSETLIHLECQKTSDNTYQNFTEIFDGITIPIHIEIQTYATIWTNE